MDNKGRKTGGRKKGTPNKIQNPVKVLLQDFASENWEEFKKSFKEIDDPIEKCRMYKDILPYCVPKLASVEVQAEVGQKTFQDELDELSAD